jgi:hypothetical protein
MANLMQRLQAEPWTSSRSLSRLPCQLSQSPPSFASWAGDNCGSLHIGAAKRLLETKPAQILVVHSRRKHLGNVRESGRDRALRAGMGRVARGIEQSHQNETLCSELALHPPSSLATSDFPERPDGPQGRALKVSEKHRGKKGQPGSRAERLLNEGRPDRRGQSGAGKVQRRGLVSLLALEALWRPSQAAAGAFIYDPR